MFDRCLAEDASFDARKTILNVQPEIPGRPMHGHALEKPSSLRTRKSFTKACKSFITTGILAASGILLHGGKPSMPTFIRMIPRVISKKPALTLQYFPKSQNNVILIPDIMPASLFQPCMSHPHVLSSAFSRFTLPLMASERATAGDEIGALTREYAMIFKTTLCAADVTGRTTGPNMHLPSAA